jgi:hypothetical protein
VKERGRASCSFAYNLQSRSTISPSLCQPSQTGEVTANCKRQHAPIERKDITIFIHWLPTVNEYFRRNGYSIFDCSTSVKMPKGLCGRRPRRGWDV